MGFFSCDGLRSARRRYVLEPLVALYEAGFYSARDKKCGLRAELQYSTCTVGLRVALLYLQCVSASCQVRVLGLGSPVTNDANLA